MKYIKLLALFGLLTQVGCNRPEPDFTKSVITVKDYATGQPVAEAELFKIKRSDFDISCLCYWTITETKVGSTNADGQFRGDITVPGNLEIRKAGYYEAGDLNNAYLEETSGNKITYSLFKLAGIKINKNPSRSYDNLVLEVSAILKDGSVKKSFSSGILLNYLVGTPVSIQGIGDMQNRITIKQENSILLQTDFFVPANSTKEITLSY